LHELLSAGGDDWTETTIGKVALINPKEAALAKDAPFVPMDAVKVGKRFVNYFEPRGERSGARAKSGDVLFARITPCLENGKVAQIQDDVGACGGSTEFIVVRGTEYINSDFIYFWATLGSTRDSAAGLMTGTTGRQRLSAGDLGEIALNLPPLDVQMRIVKVVSSMDDVIQATEQAVMDSKVLRSGLLSDLLSGNHEIPASYDSLLGAA
jgi:type I restriction enzyme S subunit